MPSTPLRSIAQIKTGLFTKPVWFDVNVACLQIRHFSEDLSLLEKPRLDAFVDTKTFEKHALMPWDILFAAKGTRHFAALYREEYGPCVASSNFSVLRPEVPGISSEYIALVLNLMQNRWEFKTIVSGGHVPSISAATLWDIPIPLISPERQQQLVWLDRLHRRLNILYQRLTDLKKKECSRTITHLTFS